jgi:hypothetical protein
MRPPINSIIYRPQQGKDKIARGIFDICAGLLLVFILMSGKEAGISGDEEVHFRQSEKVYNYYATGSTDQNALDTPISNLKYYG